MIRQMWLNMQGVLRSARHKINQGLESLNLSSAEGDLLFLLLTGSNGLSQDELAKQLDKGKAAVSRGIDSLEKKGYVQRSVNQADRRFYSINVTEKGHLVQGEVAEVYQTMYRIATRGIAPAAFEKINELLTQVEKNLDLWEEER